MKVRKHVAHNETTRFALLAGPDEHQEADRGFRCVVLNIPWEEMALRSYFRENILSDVTIVNHTIIWQVVLVSLLLPRRLITLVLPSICLAGMNYLLHYFPRVLWT